MELDVVKRGPLSSPCPPHPLTPLIPLPPMFYGGLFYRFPPKPDKKFGIGLDTTLDTLWNGSILQDSIVRNVGFPYVFSLSQIGAA